MHKQDSAVKFSISFRTTKRTENKSKPKVTYLNEPNLFWDALQTLGWQVFEWTVFDSWQNNFFFFQVEHNEIWPGPAVARSHFLAFQPRFPPPNSQYYSS